MSNLEKFKKMPNNGIIGDGVEIAFSVTEKHDIVWAWIGTKQSGPILQYSASGEFYNGLENVMWDDGCWTPIYSRGDFKKNFSHGGHWSGHCKSLHERIADGVKPKDEHYQMLAIPGALPQVLPDGIEGDIAVTSFDCSISWAIHFKSARDAMDQRLTALEIKFSTLPQISKDHIVRTETKLVLENVNDVIDTYKL